jgi:hypothetical protein
MLYQLSYARGARILAVVGEQEPGRHGHRKTRRLPAAHLDPRSLEDGSAAVEAAAQQHLVTADDDDVRACPRCRPLSPGKHASLAVTREGTASA